MQEQGLAVEPIAARPARLLVVPFDVFGQVHVDHVAHVVFVDAHAKGNGGHHDVDFVPYELLLPLHALLAGESRVVALGLVSGRFQMVGHFLRALARQAIDNARFRGVLFHEGEQLGHLVGAGLGGVMDLGPVKAVLEQGGVFEPELSDDVALGSIVCRGGQGQHGDAGKVLRQVLEFGVGGAEVMAPRADAVGLIDGDHVDFDGLQALEQCAFQAHQALRCDVQQFHFAVSNGVENQIGLSGALTGVEVSGVDALETEVVHLVLHQGDQGRNHQG